MSSIKRISPTDAQRLLEEEGYTYVDVRSEPEYAAGHPAGALNVPIAVAAPAGMTPNPRFLEVMEKRFPRDAKIVVGCKAGGRSLRAAEMLAAAGFTGVVDQRAGWDGVRDPFGQLVEPGWSPSGLPSETSTPGGDYAAQLAKISG